MSEFADWVGRTETAEDFIAPARIAALAAALDLAQAPGPGEALPPGWHWLFFNGAARASELGPDGHPRRGGFLPPVPLRRRMWAGGRLRFQRPLRVGETVRRASEIAGVKARQGKTGPLVFVQVRHRVGEAIDEEHDIVFRAAPAPGAAPPAPPPAPAGSDAQRAVRPDPVLLFRYSALSFNGHRIHYDQPYVTGEEGYPGLVVHGPLTATLLLEHLRAHEKRSLARFEFRAVSPLFVPDPFTLHLARDGETVRLWAANQAGGLAMRALATLA